MSKYDDTPGLTNPLGTYTYTAPAEPAPKDAEAYERSVGQTGTAFWSGQLNEEEYNNDLTPRQWRGYGGSHGIADRMRREDSVVAAVERAIKLPILSSTWGVQPAEHGDAEQNRRVAEFIEAALFEHNRDSWRGWLEQALDYLVFGFMLFERVYKEVDDPSSEWFGYVTLDHLAPRMPWTVDSWIIDNTRGERLTAVAQVNYAGMPSGYPIPAWKLVRLTYQQSGSNFEGRSALRAAYRPYFIRRKAWKLWAIGLERWAVPTPIATIRETSYGAFKNQVAKALQSLRTNDKGRVVIPDSVELDSYSPKSNLDPSVFLKETAYEIVMSTLTNFLMTGRETGTQSLGKEQASFLSQSLTAITDQIAEVLSDGTDGYPGVIRQLVDLNFPGVESYPKLVCSSVGERDVVEMIDAMNKAAAAGILAPSRDDEDYIRTRLKLPSTAEEEAEVEVSLRPEQVLNGAQIMGAKAIINDAFAGAIPKAAAEAMLVSLVNLEPEQARSMLEGSAPNPGAADETLRPLFEATEVAGLTLPYPNEHAARQEAPESFKTFRRVHPEGMPEGVDLVMGIRDDGEAVVQSVRLRSDVFTEAEAREWLARNGFKTAGFEPAKPSDKLEKKTNFPRAGQDLKVSLRNSGYPIFDREYAERLKNEHPEIWKLGGNIKGNDQYNILTKVMNDGGVPSTPSQVEAVRRREAWAARHLKDFRIAGVVAQIKWLVVGSRGESHMKEVVREELKRRQKLEEYHTRTAPEPLKHSHHECSEDCVDHSRTTPEPLTTLETRPYSRALTPHERFVSLEAIERSQNKIGRQIGARLELAQEAFIEAFIDEARPLIKEGDVEGVMRITLEGVDELANELKGPLTRALELGYGSVAEEYVRQLKDLPLDTEEARPVHFEDEDLTNKEGELKDFPGAYLSGTSTIEVDLSEIPETEEIDPDKLIAAAALQAAQYTADRVQASGRNAAALQAQSGEFDGEALLGSLDSLSSKMLESRGIAAAILSFSSGRTVGGETAQSEEIVRKAFYSAVLDRDTCQPCAEVDRAHGENTDGLTPEQARTFRPPLSTCKGRDRCRCMIVYVFDDERVR